MPRTPVRAVCFSVLTLACVLDVLVAAQTATLPFLGRWKFNPAKSDLQTTRLVFTQAASGEMTMTMAGDQLHLPHRRDRTALAARVHRDLDADRPPHLENRLPVGQNRQQHRQLHAVGGRQDADDEDRLPGAEALRADDCLLARVRRTGLAGVWLTKTVQTESLLEMSSADGKTVNVSWPSFGGSAVLSTDGREAPLTGPPTAVPPGMTASLKTTGPRTFDLAMKLKGVNVTTGHFTVAADGKSMTAETVSRPARAHGGAVEVLLRAAVIAHSRTR